MEFAVPIGIIVYIILAVVGAVLKSLGSQQRPLPSPSVDPGWPPQEPEPPGLEPRKTLLDLDADRRFEEDDLSSFDEHRPISKHVPEGRQASSRLRVTKRDLMQAIIMSEVLREPRAKRPWPAFIIEVL